MQQEIIIKTAGRGLYEITPQIAVIVRDVNCASGLCHLFLRHTSASIILCENYDPQVLEDLESFMEKLVPDRGMNFQHDAEGIDDMPAHVRSVLTSNSLTIPIIHGALGLGTWQGIYLWEHRFSKFNRKLIVSIIE